MIQKQDSNNHKNRLSLQNFLSEKIDDFPFAYFSHYMVLSYCYLEIKFFQ